jgi:hypothetical protein
MDPPLSAGIYPKSGAFFMVLYGAFSGKIGIPPLFSKK